MKEQLIVPVDVSKELIKYWFLDNASSWYNNHITNYFEKKLFSKFENFDIKGGLIDGPDEEPTKSHEDKILYFIFSFDGKSPNYDSALITVLIKADTGEVYKVREEEF